MNISTSLNEYFKAKKHPFCHLFHYDMQGAQVFQPEPPLVKAIIKWRKWGIALTSPKTGHPFKTDERRKQNIWQVLVPLYSSFLTCLIYGVGDSDDYTQDREN